NGTCSAALAPRVAASPLPMPRPRLRARRGCSEGAPPRHPSPRRPRACSCGTRRSYEQGAPAPHPPPTTAGSAISPSRSRARRPRRPPARRPGAPARAGAALAGVTREADLTLFAHYDTDLVGHRGDLAAAVEVLETVDAFLAGLLDALPADSLLVIA